MRNWPQPTLSDRCLLSELILITLEEKSIKSGPDKDSSLLPELSVWEVGLSIRLKSVLSRAVGVRSNDVVRRLMDDLLSFLLQNLSPARLPQSSNSTADPGGIFIPTS